MDTETTAWTCEFYKYLLENKQFGAPVFSCPYFGKLHTEFSKSVDTETFNQRVNANDSSMASVYTVHQLGNSKRRKFLAHFSKKLVNTMYRIS